jgi:hypothetical protein
MSYHNGAKIITDGLAFYLDFSNPKCIAHSSSNAVDLSPNRIPITLTNSSANTLIITDKYAEFVPPDTSSAATYYSAANSYFNTIKNEMTLETYMYVISDMGTSVRGVSPRVSESGSPLGFAIATNGLSVETNVNNATWITSGITSSDSGFLKWVHITQTTSVIGNATTTYINGNLVGTMSLLNGIPTSGGGFLIGRGFFGGAKNYNGRVSFVRVYNRALSSGEILTNYNNIKGRFV